jgi:hypothetical protein
MLTKTSFAEINKTNRRKVILFGSGNVAKKTIRKIGRENVAFIVDNSSNLEGGTYDGFDILHPKKVSSDYFVLICSTAISDITHQLAGYGLTPNADFIISPILNDLIAISELEDLESSFYFTSGTVPLEGEKYGGGLYKCTVKASDVLLDRIYTGPCYGAIDHEGDIYFVDTDKGLFKYANGEVRHLCELPQGSRAHGISYNQSNEKFYITCSYLDAVLEINSEYQIERQFNLSSKLEKLGEPMHHCNDNLAIGNSLYVSMFSSSGNWKNDVFDGCIAEFDIESGERLSDICSGLYMPHNVKHFNGSLHVLDSLPGHLRFNNLSIQGTFPAFTRGLAYQSGLYYVGQSKNRNYSKVMGISNNISIDCGVVVFNPELKASRFLQFPHAIGEIHSIVGVGLE